MSTKLIKRFVVAGEGYAALRVARFIHNSSNAKLLLILTSQNQEGVLYEFAKANNIKLMHIEELLNPKISDYIVDLCGDCFINILSSVIIPTDVLSLFPKWALNLHTGPLPEYAGMHVHQWAIRNGEKNFSATIHKMEEGIDTGNIIAKSDVKISSTDTGLSLFNKVISSGVELFESVISDIIYERKIIDFEQNFANRNYYRHSEALNGDINWYNSSTEIINFIRAGNYKPLKSPTYTASMGDGIFIFRAEKGIYTDLSPGNLIKITDSGPIISCGNRTSILVTDAEKNFKKMNTKLWNKYFNNNLSNE